MEEWKRVILAPLWNIYKWTALLLLFCVFFFRARHEITNAVYIQRYVAIPLGAMLTVIVFARVFFHKIARRLRSETVSVIVILLMGLYVGINLWAYGYLKVMFIAAFIPIVIAPIYRNKELISFQVAVSLTVLLLYFAVNIFFEDFFSAEEQPLLEVAAVLLMFYAMVQFELEVVISTDMLGREGSTDSLTRLFNHEKFYEILREQMARYDGTQEIFSLIISDIDNFKCVNDTYGHAFGDKVIKKLSETMQEQQGRRDACARYGGEEFAIIIPNKGLNEAVLQAERIRKAFQNTDFISDDGEIHHFTISLGVAEYNRKYNTASAFFQMADEALYQAKREGKNRTCGCRLND